MCARSAYDVLSANLRLCIEYCKKLSRPGAVATLEGGKAIAITLPDVEELRRTVEYMGDAEPWPNVRLNSLGGDTAPDRNPLEGLWSNVFKQSGGGDAVVAEWAGMYVLLGASCQELPTIKKLHELQPDKPIVCFRDIVTSSPDANDRRLDRPPTRPRRQPVLPLSPPDCTALGSNSGRKIQRAVECRSPQRSSRPSGR